jgi:hypothetical protein
MTTIWNRPAGNLVSKPQGGMGHLKPSARAFFGLAPAETIRQGYDQRKLVAAARIKVVTTAMHVRLMKDDHSIVGVVSTWRERQTNTVRGEQ